MSETLHVKVSRGDIDEIHVWREETIRDGPAWGANGYKNGKLTAPDIWYQEFGDFVRHLSDYIDDRATWSLASNGDPIGVWDAMRILLESDEE